MAFISSLLQDNWIANRIINTSDIIEYLGHDKENSNFPEYKWYHILVIDFQVVPVNWYRGKRYAQQIGLSESNHAFTFNFFEDFND